jgi:hypothetical protein
MTELSVLQEAQMREYGSADFRQIDGSSPCEYGPSMRALANGGKD